LLTYIALLGASIWAGWRFAFRQRGDPRGDIALGSTIAIVVMAMHSKYEWITVTYQVQYVIAISIGIISGLVRARALEKRQARRDQAAARQAIEPAAGQVIA
jgi:predicted membrane protein